MLSDTSLKSSWINIMGGCRFCAVRGCVSRTGEGKSFFSLPKVPDLDKCLNINPSLHSLMVNRRREWLQRIDLPLETPSGRHIFVCADHFCKGNRSSHQIFLYCPVSVTWFQLEFLSSQVSRPPQRIPHTLTGRPVWIFRRTLWMKRFRSLMW